MQELKDVLRMVKEDIESNPPSVEVVPESSLLTVDDLSKSPQSTLATTEVSPVTEDTPKPLSREELKRSISLYRQELLKVQEAADFVKREKPVANINVHNAATSKTAKKLTAKQMKSKQVTNMRKVGLLAGLFKQAS